MQIINMRSSSTILFLAALATPFVAASLHSDAICVDYKGGVAVYNAGATKAACGNYRVRNTGGKQWDKCPDCEMVSEDQVERTTVLTDCDQRNIGNLDVCHSDAWHIGGDEINYYCEKINGAGGSWAN